MSAESSAVAPQGSLDTSQLRRLLIKGGMILMGTRLVMQLFTWSVTILVARFLMPFDYGVLTSGSLLLGLCDLLAEAGVGKALVQRRELTEDDVAEGFSLSLILATALYLALLAASRPTASFFDNPELVGYLRLAGLLLFLTPFRTAPLALLERGLRMGSQASIHAASATTQAALTLGLAATGWGYWSLLGGVVVARLLEVLLLARRAGWRPRLRLPRLGDAGIVPFGVHVSASSLLWFLYSNADFAVVGRLVGPVALGYYSFAFGLISLPVQKLTANVNQVVYPVFCRLQHDRATLRSWYLKVTFLLGLPAVPAMLGLALVADDAVLVILGAKWLPAVLPLRLLSVVGVLMVFGASLPPLLNAVGRPDVNLKYTVACNVVYPVSFYLLGRPYGVAGVCTAWLILYPVVLVTYCGLTRRITQIGPLDLLRTQRDALGSSLLMTIVVLATRHALHDARPGLRLCLAIGAGVLTYAAGLYLLARGAILANLRSIRTGLR